MKKLVYVLGVLFLLAPSIGFAQTQVPITATVTSSANSAPFIYGTYTIQLVDSTGAALQTVQVGAGTTSLTRFTGSMGSAGTISVSLYPNNLLYAPGTPNPAGTTWKFTPCSAGPTTQPFISTGNPVCYSSSVTIGGAGDYSAQVSAGSPAVYYVNYLTGAAYISVTGGGGSPGGSTAQMQYNCAGSFCGAAGVTTNGTHVGIGAGTVFDNGGARIPIVDDSGSGAPGKSVLLVQETNTDAEGENGLVVNMLYNPSATQVGGINGILNQTVIHGTSDRMATGGGGSFNSATSYTGTDHVGFLYGGSFTVVTTGTQNDEIDGLDMQTISSGNSSLVYGIPMNTNQKGAGTADFMADIYMIAGIDTGTVSNRYSVLADSPILSNGGTIGTNVGLGISEMSGAGITTAYQILSNGTAPSLIAGLMNFGDLVAPGILTLASGSTKVTAAGAGGWQFMCSDCNTPITEGSTCATGGDGAGALAISLRGAIKCF